MTRARDELVLMQPLRFYVRGQGYGGDRSVYAPRSRFIAESDLQAFELAGAPPQQTRTDAPMPSAETNVDLKAGMREMWR
jgi:DNA helicase II / ATP-dependent DNA helicase PcrA